MFIFLFKYKVTYHFQMLNYKKKFLCYVQVNIVG